MTRVALLADVHGNLPALEAVLGELPAVDVVVSLGDVVSGPQPAEVLDALCGLDVPMRWVRGNADRLVVDAFDGVLPEEPDSPGWRSDDYSAARITREHRDLLASFEETVSLDGVFFCHGSPRSDEEKLTRVTPEDRFARVLAGVEEPVVVCGHTHQQFDRPAGTWRVVNPGSVGMPYEAERGAYWALLDTATGEVEMRRSGYDTEKAAALFESLGYPDPVFEDVDPDLVARHFEGGAG